MPVSRSHQDEDTGAVEVGEQVTDGDTMSRRLNRPACAGDTGGPLPYRGPGGKQSRR